MDYVRVVRDQIDRGDDVLIVNHGPTPRRARVVAVLRGAAQIRYEGMDRKHTVLLKDIRRIEDASPRPTAPPPPPPPVEERTTITPPRASAVRVRGESTLPPAPPPANVVELRQPQPIDDVSAWIEMGRDLASKMREEITTLRADASALRDDARALLEESDRATARAVELEKRLRALEALAGGEP